MESLGEKGASGILPPSGQWGEALDDWEKGMLEVGRKNLQGIPGLDSRAGPRLTHQRLSLPRALQWRLRSQNPS